MNQNESHATERQEMMEALSMCIDALDGDAERAQRETASAKAIHVLGRAALKAQPAPTEAQGEPVLWFEAEASAKGQPLRDVLRNSMLYSTRTHTTKPDVTNNALWPLYEHPAPAEVSGDEPKRPPATPAEMIAFIGSHFEQMEYAPNPANVRYTLTVHDLLSAFDWWEPQGDAGITASEVQGEDSARLDAPTGWKLVPIELTDDMLVAFAEVWYTKVRCIDDCEMADCYAAMLAAAPEAPGEAQTYTCTLDGGPCGMGGYCKTCHAPTEAQGRCTQCNGIPGQSCYCLSANVSAMSVRDFEAWLNAEYPRVGDRRPKYQQSTVMDLMFAAWTAALSTNPNLTTSGATYQPSGNAGELAKRLANRAGLQPVPANSYTCNGKGGDYEFIGTAHGAGTSRERGCVLVYMDVAEGALYFRTPTDFADRMAAIPKNLTGKIMNKYHYPTQEKMSQDVNLETSAIATAVEAMSDAIKDCPLSDSLKIYAAIELAFKYCTPEHVEEVFAEIVLVRGDHDFG